MSFVKLKRILQNSWHNIWRNKLTSVTTVILMTLIIFIFNIILSLNFTAHKVLNTINQKIDINVNIHEEANKFSIQALLTDLSTVKGVKDVIYVSKDQALSSFQKTFPDLDLTSFLTRFNEPNPLPASISVITDGITYNEGVIAFLSQPQYKKIIDTKAVQNNTEEQTRIKRLENITKFIYEGGIFLNIVFVAISMLIIFNAIKMTIHYHRKEINIMRLVGATYSYIRLPFLIEGCVFGLFAIFVAHGLLSYLFVKTRDLTQAVFIDPFINDALSSVLQTFSQNSTLVLTLESAALILFALMSSFLAIQTYLMKEEVLG